MFYIIQTMTMHSYALDHFAGSTFVTRRQLRKGIAAWVSSDGVDIEVFTSHGRFEQMFGPKTTVEVTGARLLAEAPVGHRYVIDRGSSNEYIVDPATMPSRTRSQSIRLAPTLPEVDSATAEIQLVHTFTGSPRLEA